MTRKVVIIGHPNRLDIERRYLAGENISKLSKEYNISYHTLYNHCKTRISRQMRQAVAKKELAQNFDLMQEFTQLMADLKQEIAEHKTAREHGHKIKSQSNLIKLYGVMCQFASTFYEIQKGEHEQSRDEIIFEYEQQREADNADNMKVLNRAEMEMLFQLSIKMYDRDETRIIIPDTDKYNFDDIVNSGSKPKRTKRHRNIPADKENALELRKTGLKQELKDEIKPDNVEPEQDAEDKDKVMKPGGRTIKPTEIGVTKWEENELNPRYHLRKEREKQEAMDDPEVLKEIKKLKGL